jgi:hypothetical protein
MELFNYDIIKAHPNFLQIEENIWVIKDFIPSETCDTLTAFAESVPEKQWWERNNRSWWHGKFLYTVDNEEINKINKEIKATITPLFADDWFFSDLGSIHRIQKGEDMFIHSDNPTEEMGKNNFVQLAFTMYLSDFEGGEIFYPKLLNPEPLEYKASKGDMLIHPGVGRYCHGVRTVTGDKVRYVTTTFAYDQKVKALRDKGLVFQDAETGEPIPYWTQGQALNPMKK